MTRNETKHILMTMDALYPNFKPSDLTLLVDSWAVVLNEYDFEAIYRALIAFVKTDTSGFAPSIGQLLAVLKNDNGIDTEYAASLVRKAVKNSCYNAEDEFSRLPKEVQKAVGTPSTLRAWGQLSQSEFESVALSHFRRSYNIIQKRLEIENEKNNILIPQNEMFALPGDTAP